MTLVEIVGIFLGTASIAFNLFQLYKERVLRDHVASEKRLSEATLVSLFRSLSNARRKVIDLAGKGSEGTVIASGVVGTLDAECIHIDELVKTCYANGVSPVALLAASDVSVAPGVKPETELISGVEEMTRAMLEATENAKQYVFVVGGRSRNDTYLKALANRVRQNDVRYVRVLTGDHIRHPLCAHLQEVWNEMDLGYLLEDKYGGILATSDTVIVALQSSRVPALDKGLRIRSAALASDYRAYILELLGTASRTVTMDVIRQTLCKTCRPSSPWRNVAVSESRH